MRKVLLLSPHFDDAILSAGQLLAGRPDAVVCTVFAGTPENAEEIHTDYDIKCGFKDAKDAMSVRAKEDDEATALLGAEYYRLDFLDGQYGDRDEGDYVKLCETIDGMLQEYDYEFVVGPLGLGHPDHVLVSDALRRVQRYPHIKTPVYFWEDLPLRVIEPELVQERLNKLYLKDKISPGTGDIAKKIRALSCYKSQIGTGVLDPYVMYVPERFWKV